MPKRSNQASNIGEPAEQLDVHNGKTDFASEVEPSDESTNSLKQIEANDSAQQQSNQQVNGHSPSQQPQRSFAMHASNDSSQANDKKWGTIMQTQSDSTQFDPMQSDSTKFGSTKFGNSTQLEFNYAQLLTLGDAKRWFSLLGGAYLAIYGLSRSLGNLTVVGAGLGLLYYATTGHWPLTNRGGEGRSGQGASQSGRGATGTNPLSALRLNADSTTTKNIIVKAPLNEVYQAWANFENFSHFMQHIKSVAKTGDHTSHWVMEGPLNTQIEWDAETTRLDENKRIAWSSITGDIKTSGQVTFNELSSDETEVTVMLKYVPPAGLAGEIVAELFGNPEGKLVEDLRNFKRTIETKQAQMA